MYYNGQIRRQITATKKKTTTKTSRIVCIFYSPIVLVILCSYSRVNITSYISASFRNFFYCDRYTTYGFLSFIFSIFNRCCACASYMETSNWKRLGCYTKQNKKYKRNHLKEALKCIKVYYDVQCACRDFFRKTMNKEQLLYTIHIIYYKLIIRYHLPQFLFIF